MWPCVKSVAAIHLASKVYIRLRVASDIKNIVHRDIYSEEIVDKSTR